MRRTVTAGGYCHVAAGDDRRTFDRDRKPLAITGGCTEAIRRTDREPWNGKRGTVAGCEVYETAFSRTGSFQPGLTKWQV